MTDPKDPRLEDLDRFEQELEGTTVVRLRGEDPRALEWRPDDGDLIRFVRARHEVEPALRARIASYLESHPAERDALAAFERLAPAPPVVEAQAASLLSRLRERLSLGLGSFGGAQSAVAAAASLALVVGVGLLLRPDEPVWRGDEVPIEGPAHPQAQGPAGEWSAEIELLPEVPVQIEAGSLPAHGELVLTLAVPGEIPASGLELRLVREGAAVPLRVEDASPGSAARLVVPVSELTPGRYRVEAIEPGVDALPLLFPLEVR